MPNSVFISLGSNLNNPQQQLLQAVQTLSKHPQLKVLKCSSHYRNPPLVNPASSPDHPAISSQPDYINAVAQLETTLTPLQLLDTLQTIEQQQGRVRSAIRWQARTLDLDILLYNNQNFDSDRLQIPHPQMMHRSFVLYPLYEIAPELVLNDGTVLHTALRAVNGSKLEKIAISS